MSSDEDSGDSQEMSGRGAYGPEVDVPEPLAELVVACRNYVHQALGVALDFQPETLPLLDHYLERSREELLGRPEVAELTLRAAGAYFGEVARRHVGGFWLVPGPNVHDWAVCGRHAFVSFNPVGAAYDALYQSSEHPGPSAHMRFAPDERELVLARLGTIEVDEEEYFLLTTRLEALEIAVEALRRHLEDRGYGDTEFAEDDYLQEMKGFV
ncbi:MAG TPA: hypothetical protein VKZ49_02920 [Polyangiaceae bacterium]|nr:hypothetical protein [Polyangiaceae bacterium]